MPKITYAEGIPCKLDLIFSCGDALTASVKSSSLSLQSFNASQSEIGVLGGRLRNVRHIRASRILVDVESVVRWNAVRLAIKQLAREFRYLS